MTDRELLEKAAKAAGVEVAWRLEPKCLCLADALPYYVAWNPLANSADALDLAARLKIAIDFDGIKKGAAQAMQTDRDHWEVEPYGADQYAATRRAIVKAAAALVK